MTKKDEPIDTILELADNALGRVEDLSNDEIRRFLTDSTCDTTALKLRLYERAVELRGVYWQSNKEEPADLKDFITQLRPADSSTAEPERQRLSAHKWFTQLFERTPAANSAITYAFHRREHEINEHDEAKLRELAEQLKKKIQEEDK